MRTGAFQVEADQSLIVNSIFGEQNPNTGEWLSSCRRKSKHAVAFFCFGGTEACRWNAGEVTGVDGEFKGRAATGRTARGNGTTHDVDAAPRDGKPKASAAVSTGRGSVGLHKRLVQARKLLGCHADASIGHFKCEFVLRIVKPPHGQGDRALISEFHCITKEIDQHLAQACWISTDGLRHIAIHDEAKGNTFLPGAVVHQAQRVLN